MSERQISNAESFLQRLSSLRPLLHSFPFNINLGILLLVVFNHLVEVDSRACGNIVW